MKTAAFAVAALVTGACTLWAQENPPISVSGSVSSGSQQVDNDTSSSKLTEYRDLRDGFFAPEIRFDIYNPRRGDFLALAATNVSRLDQSVAASFGRINLWDVEVLWNQVPHNLSNRAQTPYIARGAGLLEVPATIPITFKKLATAGPDTAGVLASDELIAGFQSRFLHPTDLSVKTDFGRIAANYGGFGVAYGTVRKDGARPAYGPIGDRPPRTLNIQLAEPVDYRTSELTVTGEHAGRNYLAQFEYLFSDFANSIDTLVWQNVYATAAPDASYDLWDRAVSTYGRRPLPPDSRYHNVSVGIAGDLPLESRVSARIAYGRMEQNETLLPYSYNSNILADAILPRATAQAEIVTTQFFADYVINPTARANVRAWLRRFGMDNDTPEDHWRYVTSDTPNLNGTVTFLNKRINAPYATDRTQAGAEVTWRLPARSTLSGGYERESLTREHREADTAEDRLTVSVRTRAARWANLRARYLLGSRKGDDYHGTFTRAGYWYAPSEAGSDNNNPQFTFDNHPDMRRFDVIDRLRKQFDVTVNLVPREALTFSGSVRYRSDDFDTDVRPVQPLADTGIGEVTATTPGDQLGLLDGSRLRYSLDLFYLPLPRVTVNAFLNHETGSSLQRGMEFNENNKANPSAVATAELGPWTRAASQWTADFDDRTWTVGIATTIQLVPDRLTMSTGYTASLADVDITYAGYGVTNWDGTPYPLNHQFAFTSPPAIREDVHVFDLRFDVPIVQRTTLSFGYTFERYLLNDWQQDPPQPWVEAVGSEFLLRDTSRSFQWGNRLFNLGTPLAPAFTAHIGWASVAVRF